MRLQSLCETVTYSRHQRCDQDQPHADQRIYSKEVVTDAVYMSADTSAGLIVRQLQVLRPAEEPRDRHHGR